MIIDLLGDVIDTSYIYSVSKVTAHYGNSGYDGYWFCINFKAKEGSMAVKLIGPDIYTQATGLAKWVGHGHLFESRSKIIKERVEKLRNEVLMAWAHEIIAGDVKMNDVTCIPMYIFDRSLPYIDLRKDGVSINVGQNPLGSISAAGLSGVVGSTTSKGFFGGKR